MALTYKPTAGSIQSTIGGTRTVSQEKAKMLASLDPAKLTPFEIEQLGGKEKIEREKKLAQQLIESEKVSPNAKLAIKNQPVKEAAKPIAKPVEENNEPKLWRVMLPGSDPSQDYFYETQKEATDALNRERSKILAMRERRKLERDQMIQTLGEKETIRRLGKNAIETDINKVGAIAGIKLPDKTDEELIDLKDKYRQRVASSISEASVRKPETEEERLTRKLIEAGATPEQRDRYMKTLSESRQRGRERAGYAEEYAALGRVPTAQEERKMASEARDRKMSNFLLGVEARKNALEKEQSFNKELNYLKRLERQQRGDQRFASALATKLAQDELINKYGGGINNSSDRRRFFQREAMDDYRSEIEARDRMRREQFKKQTDAAPEASSSFSSTTGPFSSIQSDGTYFSSLVR
jgi:hypothetical protein